MLTIRLLTAESQSLTVAERILTDSDGLFRIACVYRNEPNADLRGDRSEIHYGAMNLAIETTPQRRMSGHYWTDRDTRGTIELAHVSDKQPQSYATAEQIASAHG